MEDNYPKAYKEIIEILKFVPKESVDKIPKTMLETFVINMDREYDFVVDTNKEFEEQEILDETRAILANIFKDYWATPYQKERIEAKEKYDRNLVEEEKRKKYDPNNIFVNANIEAEDNVVIENIEENNLPIEVPKESFYKKIIKFFKKIFHI